MLLMAKIMSSSPPQQRGQKEMEEADKSRKRAQNHKKQKDLISSCFKTLDTEEVFVLLYFISSDMFICHF